MARDQFKVEGRLYRDAVGRIVRAGDPTAAFLYATPGDEISIQEAEEAGVVSKPKPKAKQGRKAEVQDVANLPAGEPPAPAESEFRRVGLPKSEH